MDVASGAIGALISTLMSLVALKRKLLKFRGAVIAIVIGVLVSTTGIENFVILLIFFCTSSALTKLKGGYKASLGLKDVSGRSIGQVFGVGTPIAVYALLSLFNADFRIAMLTSIAVANADTWASEIGIAFGGEPRMLTKPWRRVRRGESGGVTLVGTLASIAGSTAIALSAVALAKITPFEFAVVAVMGYLGELFDSLVGATIQARYVCNGVVVEEPLCENAKLIKGVRWMTNEMVNLMTGLLMGAASVLLIATW